MPKTKKTQRPRIARKAALGTQPNGPTEDMNDPAGSQPETDERSGSFERTPKPVGLVPSQLTARGPSESAEDQLNGVQKARSPPPPVVVDLADPKHSQPQETPRPATTQEIPLVMTSDQNGFKPLKPSIIVNKTHEVWEKFRRAGTSIGRIAELWGVPKSEVHYWIGHVKPELPLDGADHGQANDGHEQTNASAPSRQPPIVNEPDRSTSSPGDSTNGSESFMSTSNGGDDDRLGTRPLTTQDREGRRPRLPGADTALGATPYDGESYSGPKPNATIDPIQRQFSYAALAMGMSVEDFLEAEILPSIKFTQFARQGLHYDHGNPERWEESLEESLLEVIETANAHRRMTRMAREEAHREMENTTQRQNGGW